MKARTFRPHKQRILHDPDNGLYGDCQRTCLAMVLGLDPEEVPHFADKNLYPGDGDTRAAERAWLAEQGFGYCQMPVIGNWGWDWVERILDQQPNTPMIISGRSPRGPWNHDIVWLNGLAHDPHPDGTGLAGPCLDAASDGDVEWYWINAVTQLAVRA